MSALNGVPQLANVAETLPYFSPQQSRVDWIEVDAFGSTDAGLRRRNEDQFVIAKLSRQTELECSSLPVDTCFRMWSGTEGRIFAVADGMGGHHGGDVASTLVLQAMLEHVIHNVSWPGEDRAATDSIILEELAGGLGICKARLRQLAQSWGNRRRKPGSTLTLGYMVWPTLYLLHVGDSRAYLHHSSQLRCLTSDHTVAEMLRKKHGGQGVEPPENLKNVLAQAVSASDNIIVPELHAVPLCPGDSLLLCSDGLTNEVSEDVIARELGEPTPARVCSERLIEAALGAGGRDNVTALTVRF
jgi:protein phosphatase